ncbi:MAG: PD-(D/E)XK nuclease family protein, partial [Myxococcales bacterium]
ALGALAVPPGLHAPQAGSHPVTWWDPRALDLEREAENWLRERDLLLVPDGAAEAASQAHRQWQQRRASALESGSRPSLRVETATARSQAEPAAQAVALETVEMRDFARPGGKRFGSLVHAVLAEVHLGAVPEEVTKIARAQGRLLGASEEEVAAAARAASAALSHPLLRRAACAEECRREEPILHRLEDGTLLEGVVDLAFRDASGWTVVDFKTDAQPGSHPQYAAQLHLYCAAITAVSGLPAHGTLLAV